MNTGRWLGALDALAPYLIAVVAVAVARHAFASTQAATTVAITALVLLAGGALVPFFRTVPAAHLTWPVAFVLYVIFLPLLALHVAVESRALAAPVAIHLLPLAFTWTALVIVFCLATGIVFSTAARYPGWAGVVVCPFAVLLGAVPVLSVDLSRAAVLTAALYTFALGEIASGVAWLVPERRRWLLVPVVMALAAAVEWRAFTTTPHHLPGRVLLLVDVCVAVIAGITALAAPLLCRWLVAPTSE